MSDSINVTLDVPDNGVRGYFVQVSQDGSYDITDAVDFAWIIGDHEHLDSADEFLAKLP